MKKYISKIAMVSALILGFSSYQIYANESGQTSFNNTVDVTFLGQGGGISHDHVLTTNYDKSGHWSECSVYGCDYKTDIIEHKYEQYEFATEPACNSHTQNKFKCTDCMSSYAEPNPEHTLSEDFIAISQQRYAYKMCTVCGVSPLGAEYCSKDGELIFDLSTSESDVKCDTCKAIYGPYIYWETNDEGNLNYVPDEYINKDDSGNVVSISIPTGVEHQSVLFDQEHRHPDVDYPYTKKDENLEIITSFDEVKSYIRETDEGTPIVSYLEKGSINSIRGDSPSANGDLKTALGKKYTHRSFLSDNFYDNQDDFKSANKWTYTLDVPENFWPSITSVAIDAYHSSFITVAPYSHAYVDIVPSYEDEKYPDRITSMKVTKIVWFDTQESTRFTGLVDSRMWINGYALGTQLKDKDGNPLNYYNVWSYSCCINKGLNTDLLAPKIQDMTTSAESSTDINGQNIAKKVILSLSASEEWSTKCLFMVYSDEACTTLFPGCPETGIVGTLNSGIFTAQFDLSEAESNSSIIYVKAFDGINYSDAKPLNVCAFDNKSPVVSFNTK